MGLFSRKKQAEPSPCSQSNGNYQPPGHFSERNRHRPEANLSPSLFTHPPPPRDGNHTRPVGSPAVGPPVPAPYHGQDPRHYCSPIIMNQHYYLNPSQWPPPPPTHLYPSPSGGHTLNKWQSASTSNLIQLPANVVNQIVDDGLPRWHAQGTQLINQGAALFDQISSRLNDVMTLIDQDKLKGNENSLFMYQQPQSDSSTQLADMAHHSAISKGKPGKGKKKNAPKGQTSAVAATLLTGGYFAKVDLYANSKLPLDLPPFRE